MGPLDGEMLVGGHRLGVAEPGDGELGGALHGAGEDDRATDARLQVLGGQGHSQGLWWDKHVHLLSCADISI